MSLRISSSERYNDQFFLGLGEQEDCFQKSSNGRIQKIAINTFLYINQPLRLNLSCSFEMSPEEQKGGIKGYFNFWPFFRQQKLGETTFLTEQEEESLSAYFFPCLEGKVPLFTLSRKKGKVVRKLNSNIFRAWTPKQKKALMRDLKNLHLDRSSCLENTRRLKYSSRFNCLEGVRIAEVDFYGDSGEDCSLVLDRFRSLEKEAAGKYKRQIQGLFEYMIFSGRCFEISPGALMLDSKGNLCVISPYCLEVEGGLLYLNGLPYTPGRLGIVPSPKKEASEEAAYGRMAQKACDMLKEWAKLLSLEEGKFLKAVHIRLLTLGGSNPMMREFERRVNREVDNSCTVF